MSGGPAIRGREREGRGCDSKCVGFVTWPDSFLVRRLERSCFGVCLCGDSSRFKEGRIEEREKEEESGSKLKGHCFLRREMPEDGDFS